MTTKDNLAFIWGGGGGGKKLKTKISSLYQISKDARIG